LEKGTSAKATASSSGINVNVKPNAIASLISIDQNIPGILKTRDG
jgi:hypothetical protein